MKTWLMTVSVVAVLVSSMAQAADQKITLKDGDPEAGKAKANAVCQACHAADGNSIVPIWPSLAGQHPEYIYKQLMDFKSGARSNVQMTPMAQPLTEQEVVDVAAYFSQQQMKPAVADPEKAKLGEKIYRTGNPATGVPACSGCHGPAGMGQSTAKFPRIAGQHADYIKQTLGLFRSHERANDPNGMMEGVTARMTDAEMEAVAQYVQGLSD